LANIRQIKSFNFLSLKKKQNLVAMKNAVIKLIILVFTVNLSFSQEWMTNLEIAQNLALVQNKMVLMVWEETTKYQYPVLANDGNGRILLLENLFTDEYLSPLIWENFVPVIVSEHRYAELYEEIKKNRRQLYREKFNDDSVKIMDVNGYIINVRWSAENYINITTLIEDYAFNTEFLAAELRGYREDKNFYSAYYLAAKYMDFAMYAKQKTRPEIIDLSHIYMEEALALIDINDKHEALIQAQRIELLKIQEYLLDKRPKKVLRSLKRMDADEIENNNKAFAAFLYYTSYSILNDTENAEQWKSEISSVNLRKAQLIINLNS